MRHEPSSLERDPERAMKLVATDPLLTAAHKVGRLKPEMQWRLRLRRSWWRRMRRATAWRRSCRSLFGLRRPDPGADLAPVVVGRLRSREPLCTPHQLQRGHDLGELLRREESRVEFRAIRLAFGRVVVPRLAEPALKDRVSRDDNGLPWREGEARPWRTDAPDANAVLVVSPVVRRLAARPADPSRPHPGDERRVLPPEALQRPAAAPARPGRWPRRRSRHRINPRYLTPSADR